jgi:hypothetical protein
VYSVLLVKFYTVSDIEDLAQYKYTVSDIEDLAQ